MVTIKSEREIELMREAGKILAKDHTGGFPAVSARRLKIHYNR